MTNDFFQSNTVSPCLKNIKKKIESLFSHCIPSEIRRRQFLLWPVFGSQYSQAINALARVFWPKLLNGIIAPAFSPFHPGTAAINNSYLSIVGRSRTFRESAGTN